MLPLPAQQTDNSASPVIRTTVDEVVLDLIVRDKKGKPVTDLKPVDLTVLDNDARQTLTGFRLVSGSEAIGANGAKVALDPLRQVRLVTLAFESTTEASQRKLSREAARDLVQGGQGANVFYSVVIVNTQLMALQPFTTDKAALVKAIDRATEGLGGPGITSESAAIQAELQRNLSNENGSPQSADVLAAASAAASAPVSNGAQALQAKLASVMLDMLRLDAAAGTQGARMTLAGLRALVDGQRTMPGRKSVVYFTSGMRFGPELDAQFRNLVSVANRNNVTFYSVDTRGVMVTAQTTGARAQLAGAAAASATTTARTSGAVTKDEIMASDNAEVSGRQVVSGPLRDLAESTGGFLIGDSNDLRSPLRRVNEDIASYYELSFNPGIKSYDGSFHKLGVIANRKDLVIHSRAGYVALPPNVRGDGLQPFEPALLELLSKGATSEDVHFRAAGIVLEPAAQGRSVLGVVELPLHELEPAPGAAGPTRSVRCSVVALVKNASGEVVDKLARDRSFTVTPEQLKGGNFLEKTTWNLPAGIYTLETAVKDQTSGKAGVTRSGFTIPAETKGVGISSIVVMRSYAPSATTADPNDPFRFQGGIITPTLDTTVKREANGALRLFFTVYQDGAGTKPSAQVEILQGGRSLTKVPLELPAPDRQGHIPYLMTIPTGQIPPGVYDVRAVARQGESAAEARTSIRIVE